MHEIKTTPTESDSPNQHNNGLRTLAAISLLSMAAATGYGVLTARETEQKLDGLGEEIAQLEDRYNALINLSGLTVEQVDEHLLKLPIPEAQKFPEELERLQDNATLHLLSFYPGDVNGENVVSGHACNVVKVSDNQVSTAAHCTENSIFSDSMAFITDKGGGEPKEPVQRYSSMDHFVSNNPDLTYRQAQQSAMRVVGYGDNIHLGLNDGAIMALEPGEDGSHWYDEIDSLPMRETVPQTGESVRVSGHTTIDTGELEKVAAEGVVLGQVPGSIFGYSFTEDFLMVAVPLNEDTKFACNHGESGSALVDINGEAFGALAYVGRSANPNEASVDVVPSIEQVLEVETLTGARLAGTDFVLCGYSSTAGIDTQPIEYIQESSTTPYGKGGP